MKLRRAITFSEADLSVKADLVSPPWQPWLKRAVQTLGRRVFLSIEDCRSSVLPPLASMAQACCTDTCSSCKSRLLDEEGFC